MTPSSPRPAVLEFSAVHKKYGDNPVLRGIELAVPQGAFFGLAGVNGAGKTTLIKCLLDFCRMDSGHIRIHGQAAHTANARSQLAYLPERFVPPWFLNGEEFLRYQLSLAGQTYQPEAAQGMLARLDLDLAALKKPVRSFSKGMTQKLGLAAAFLSNKTLLILDEPMSGLDPRARARLKALMREIQQAGRSIFFSTHTLSDIGELCDGMAILDQGSIRYAGTPQRCLQQFDAETLETAFLHCLDLPPHGETAHA